MLLAILPTQSTPNHTHIHSRSRHIIVRPSSLAKACGLGVTLSRIKLAPMSRKLRGSDKTSVIHPRKTLNDRGCVLVAGAFGNFCTEATGFSHLFPGLRSHLLMLPFWFRVPFFRDYIMCGGLVSSCKSSLSYLVSRPNGGNVAVIAVGGATEALDARPGALTLQVKNRKGFIKLALKHGAQLVPVFSFGENELFDQMENPAGSHLRRLQNRLQNIMGIAMPLFHARGVFQYSFGLIPYRKSIHTIVGKPIPVSQTTCPSSEDIDALHRVYLQSLMELFEENKTTYGLEKDQHLTFI
ncbi:2-acylglycerol O-acyltransferase 2-A [Xenotaenia resolanae]|uniref:2-acylglycerol O-acyltransferase 2-A n=1 Tax=Xenotaenia resolanae TaxID=208358 RepID=A0ABV0VPR2_9TELE